MKERNYGLDLMRVFLCLCVITLHSFNWFGDLPFLVSLLVPVFLIAADGLFYMLSGYFNLEKNLNDSVEIKKYYKSRIITVLIPFLAFNLFWTVWDYIHINDKVNVLEIFSIYYKTIMETAADGHLWFMYPLFGLLLSAPFLSKMLHNMDEKELKLLWYIAIGFNVLCYFLCLDMGVSLRVLSWVLDGWVIYFVGGYYYRHVVVNQSKVKWTILGLLSLTITIVGLRGDLPFIKNFIGGTDIQPMFTIFCMAYLFFWDKTIKITNKNVAKVIKFLSRNTFLIYLYHMRGIEYVLRKFAITEPSVMNGFVVVFGTFAISLIAAFVTNACLKPVQDFIDKKWIIKE